MTDKYLNNVKTKFRVKYFLFCVIYLLSFYTSGLFFVRNSECAELVDRIVAVVNDDILTYVDMNKTLEPYMERIDTFEYSPEQKDKMHFKIREDILNQLIDQTLIDQEAKRLKIKVSDKEIDNTIERIKQENFYTDEELRKNLAGEGFTFEEYRKQLKEQMLRTKLINREIRSKVVITKEDIKAFYLRNSDKYCRGNRYHLKNIIMMVPQFAGESEKKAIYDKMEMILLKLKEGEPFEKIAAGYSESPNASEGGDLGLFTINSLEPRLQTAIKELKKGDFTDIIETEQGYQIFYIQDIVETSGISLKDASAEIEKNLFNEAVNEKIKTWLKDLRKRSQIKMIR